MGSGSSATTSRARASEPMIRSPSLAGVWGNRHGAQSGAFPSAVPSGGEDNAPVRVESIGALRADHQSEICAETTGGGCAVEQHRTFPDGVVGK